jgi:predicted Fe-Mo cluster-binding NifX family protein
MRLAVTAQGSSTDSALDPRFGRARCFVLADTQTGEFKAVDNAVNLNATQGAGIQAARQVVDSAVQAVITGHVGPKAFSALKSGGVQVYTGATGTVADAVRQYQEGQLKLMKSADVAGHWA